MRWTKEITWARHHHSQSSFIWPAEGFINNPKRGIQYIKKQMVPYLGGGECFVNKELICLNINDWSKVRDTKILVLGGGPTTNAVDWKKEEYDLIVSCNHFFKNKKIKDTELFMVFLGDEVDLSHDDLLSYLNKYPTLVCFENIGRNPNDLKSFKEKNSDKTLWAHTRYHSKIGAASRIVSLFCNFRPFQIDIVGMDGYIEQKNRERYSHSFQVNKNMGGTFENSNVEKDILKKYKQQYLEFWDYILHDVGKNIKFKNLGHGHPCNLSTEVLTEQLGEQYQDYLYDIEQRNK